MYRSRWMGKILQAWQRVAQVATASAPDQPPVHHPHRSVLLLLQIANFYAAVSRTPAPTRAEMHEAFEHARTVPRPCDSDAAVSGLVAYALRFRQQLVVRCVCACVPVPVAVCLCICVALSLGLFLLSNLSPPPLKSLIQTLPVVCTNAHATTPGTFETPGGTDGCGTPANGR